MTKLTEVVTARKRKDEALDEYRDAVCEAYRDGESAYAIAKVLGVHLRAVLDILDRRGARR